MPDQNDDRSKVAGDADALAHLIRTAGRRVGPPAATYERALAAATAAWDAKVRRRRLWRVGGTLAASVAIAAVAMFIATAPRGPAPLVGRTDRIVGTLQIESSSGHWTTSADAVIDLRAGMRVRTPGRSRAGILLVDDISLRLAEATEISLESQSAVRVLSGTIYIDTGSSAYERTDRRIEVITPAGIASDLGTQFELRYGEGAIRLRVREGRVALQRESGTIDSSAGEEVTIRGDGAVARSRIAMADTDWQWVQSVAPEPDVDGQPVSFLLAWVIRETGKVVRFEKPEIEHKAATTILHGNIRNLAPLEALAAMLATTDLEHAILEDGTILIRSRTVQQR